MKLYIDHREDSANNKRGQKIKQLLLETNRYAKVYTPFKEEDIEIIQLQVGDIVYGDVCIEIKEEEDLINSIKDKHLFDQIKKMELNYKHNFLILIGHPDKLKEACKPVTIWKGGKSIKTKGTDIKSVNGVLASSRIRSNIHVESYLTLEDAIDSLIPVLFKGNDGKSSKSGLEIKQRKFNKSNDQINVLISYKGVSESIAKNLLNHFGSVKNVLNADVKELEKVDKVGKVIAKRIVDTNNKEIIESKIKKINLKFNEGELK